MTKQDIASLEADVKAACGITIEVLAKRGGKGYTVLVDGAASRDFPELVTGRDVSIGLACMAIGGRLART